MMRAPINMPGLALRLPLLKALRERPGPYPKSLILFRYANTLNSLSEDARDRRIAEALFSESAEEARKEGDIEQEAEALANSVSRFELGEGAAPSRAARAPARSAPAPVRPAHRPVTQMRTTGSGGAARKPQPVVSEDGWEEF